MAFPRIPELLHLILGFLDAIDLHNARLVAKDFAAAGQRHLFRTVKLSREPGSLDKVLAISRHSVLRYHVHRLVYSFTGYSRHNDRDKLWSLLSNFPHLKGLLFEPLPVFEEVTFDPDSSLSSADAHALLYSEMKAEELEIHRLLPINITRSPPPCFLHLRKLSIWFTENFSGLEDIENNSIFQSLPILEELTLVASKSYDEDAHMPVLFGLPATLRVLILEYAEIPADFTFPPGLQQLQLTSIKLLGRYLADWTEKLEPLQIRCTFAEHFTAELDGDIREGKYRNCDDEVFGSLLGHCLSLVCGPLFPSDLRRDLLRELFGGQCRRLDPIMSGKLIVSDEISSRYHKVLNDMSRPSPLTE